LFYPHQTLNNNISHQPITSQNIYRNEYFDERNNFFHIPEEFEKNNKDYYGNKYFYNERGIFDNDNTYNRSHISPNFENFKYQNIHNTIKSKSYSPEINENFNYGYISNPIKRSQKENIEIKNYHEDELNQRNISHIKHFSTTITKERKTKATNKHIHK